MVVECVCSTARADLIVPASSSSTTAPPATLTSILASTNSGSSTYPTRLLLSSVNLALDPNFPIILVALTELFPLAVVWTTCPTGGLVRFSKTLVRLSRPCPVINGNKKSGVRPSTHDSRTVRATAAVSGASIDSA